MVDYGWFYHNILFGNQVGFRVSVSGFFEIFFTGFWALRYMSEVFKDFRYKSQVLCVFFSFLWSLLRSFNGQSRVQISCVVAESSNSSKGKFSAATEVYNSNNDIM